MNIMKPVICENSLKWAITLTIYEIEALVKRFESNEIGNDLREELRKEKELNNKEKLMKEAVLEFFTAKYSILKWNLPGVTNEDLKIFRANKLIPHTYIYNRLKKFKDFSGDKYQKPSSVIRGEVIMMVENGLFTEITEKEKTLLFKSSMLSFKGKMYFVKD